MEKIELLNSLFEFCNLSFKIDYIIVESGQRIVYKGSAIKGDSVVIKVLEFNELKVARIKREISILSAVNSDYFPRFYSHIYISKSVIDEYIDNLNSHENKELITELRATPPKPFFVTFEEYIESIGWSEFLRQVIKEQDIVDFAQHLFNALEILWEKKIVHRDIKPDNILIRSNLRPVVIDLGVAKSLREGTQNLTVLGVAPFTPQYAAPEQFESGADVSYKADQFAVGVILYHLMTGTFPYGRYVEVELEGLQQKFAEGPPILINSINKNISATFALFINRLLEVRPYKRYRSINNIRDILNKMGRS